MEPFPKQPVRARLHECEKHRAAYLERKRAAAEERLRALRDCETRIEAARSRVFEAQDGVVTALMTDLEREWRSISKRVDRDQGLMELWALIAPPHWLDRKMWRDSEPELQLDAAIALASDVDVVDAAEAKARMLYPRARRVRFRMVAESESMSYVVLSATDEEVVLEVPHLPL